VARAAETAMVRVGHYEERVVEADFIVKYFVS
jgi:hypothetical protein